MGRLVVGTKKVRFKIELWDYRENPFGYSEYCVITKTNRYSLASVIEYLKKVRMSAGIEITENNVKKLRDGENVSIDSRFGTYKITPISTK